MFPELDAATGRVRFDVLPGQGILHGTGDAGARYPEVDLLGSDNPPKALEVARRPWLAFSGGQGVEAREGSREAAGAWDGKGLEVGADDAVASEVESPREREPLRHADARDEH